MVSGSVALMFYAVPRMTRDVDVVVELEPADVAAFTALFDPAEFYYDASAIREAVARRDMFNLIHLASGWKIDFVVRKASDYRKLELSRRRRLELEAGALWVVAPEDLLLSKLHWARLSRTETQLDDVRNLIAGVELDWDYVREWAPELGVEALLDEVRE